jgi:type 1 fimbria pilin
MYRKCTLVMGLTLALVAGMQVARAEGGSITVKGYVLDSACAFTKNLSKPISADCAVACAKAGSPLVILADDGTIYWPISDASSLPAKGQNDRVMKFAGQQVSVQGTVYAKGGSHAIVIQKIEAAAAK